MSDSWLEMSLEEAGVLLIDCEHRTPAAAEEGYPYVAIPQLRDGRIDFSTARRITRDDFISWTRKARPQAFDVVLSRRCNPGETAFAPSDTEFAVGQNLVLLRADGTKVYPAFLRWLVRSEAWWEQVGKFINVGAVFDSLKCADVPKFVLPIPSLPEQQAINDVLGPLDDKIELNRRMNETLEEIAQAIFKSWFIDFDPVRAKMENRDPRLASEIADLFPDRLVESELGEIPEGWSVVPLDQMGRFLNGLALQKFPPEDGQWLPVIKIAQLRAGSVEGADRASAGLDADYVVEDGDILFSWSGSLECVFWAGGRGALNQHLFKVTSERYPRWLLYLAIHQHLEEFRQIAAGKATTMGHIQRHHLGDAKIAIPPDKLLRACDKVFSPIVEGTWKRQLESCTLAAIRDQLLPKLISGEIRVAAAREAVGA